MSNEDKTTGEKIVEMLCDGMTIKQISSDLNIPRHTIDERFRVIQRGAGLPEEKRSYKARKEDILANVLKWKEHKKRLAEIEQEYRESLVYFDF